MNRPEINVQFRITSHVVDNISRRMRFLHSDLTYGSLHYTMIGGADDVCFQFAMLSAPFMWMGTSVSIQLEKEL